MGYPDISLAARLGLFCALLLPVLPAHAAEDSYTQEGKASYYHKSLDGEKTASGETLDNDEMVAAHKTLPLGTKVKVTNLENDREVTVRIIDRGPHARGRVIDLSRSAARKMDMMEEGEVPVKVEKIE